MDSVLVGIIGDVHFEKEACLTTNPMQIAELRFALKNTAAILLTMYF